MKRLSVTQHAAERWKERVEPELTVARAQERILDLWPTASRLRDKTKDGAERWRIAEPLAEILVRQEREEAVAVSVIGPDEIERGDQSEQEDMAQVLVEEDKWPPHGELELRVKIKWDLKGGTRTSAADSIARCAKRRIRELVGTSTGNACIDSVEILG